MYLTANVVGGACFLLLQVLQVQVSDTTMLKKDVMLATKKASNGNVSLLIHVTS